MREAVGRALNSSDLAQHEYEAAIDRVGALAKATELGRALFHWVYGGDETASRSAYKHLLKKAQRKTRVYRHHKEFSLLEAVVKLVLYEWKYQHCIACGGAKEFMDEEKKLKIVCQTCRGSGKRRYSDGERMDALKMDAFTYKRWERNISEVWHCVTGADISTAVVCRAQLER
jgi:hypothetical protein